MYDITDRNFNNPRLFFCCRPVILSPSPGPETGKLTLSGKSDDVKANQAGILPPEFSPGVFFFSARCPHGPFTLMFFQQLFADAYRLGRHLNQLVFVNEFQRLFQTELNRWRQQ